MEQTGKMSEQCPILDIRVQPTREDDGKHANTPFPGRGLHNRIGQVSADPCVDLNV